MFTLNRDKFDDKIELNFLTRYTSLFSYNPPKFRASFSIKCTPALNRCYQPSGGRVTNLRYQLRRLEARFDFPKL